MPPSITPRQQMDRDALRHVLALAGSAAGAGAGLRGLVGLHNLLRRNLNPAKPETLGTTELPVLTGTEHDQKRAGFEVTRENAIPWVLPAKILGGAAATYGGWKLMDHLLDKRRRDAIHAEVDQARDEFQRTLLRGNKQAAVHDKLVKVGRQLDDIYDRYQKVAFDPLSWLANAAGMTAGGYLTGAGLGAYLAGRAAYHVTDKASRHQILEKARKERERQIGSVRPFEVVPHMINEA